MVTTKKSARETPPAGGAASGRGLPARGWIGLVALGVVCLAALAGCGESPAQRKLARGIELLQAGRAAEAVAPFREAVDLFATNHTARAGALNYLGLAYHESGRREDASRAYLAALNADLNLVEARYNRGCLLMEKGDLPGALRELDTFLQFRPRSAPGWLQLGRVKYRLGKYAEAVAAFRKATELTSSPGLQAQALNGAGLCRTRQGRSAEAMRFFRVALARDPHYAPARLNRAILAERNHDLLGALEEYQTWLEAAPHAPQAPRVSAHVRGLVRLLQPRLPELVAETGDLARVTNLFSRVGRFEMARAAASTSAPPAAASPPPPVVPTSPPPAVVATTPPPPPGEAATSPPPALTRTSPPLPMLVLTSPPPAAATSPPPPEAAATTAPVSASNATEVATTSVSPPAEKERPATPATATKTVEEETVAPPPELVVALPPESPSPGEPAVTPKPAAEAASPAPPPASPGGREPVMFEKPAPPPPAETAPPKKASFWSKLNPVRWFRKDTGTKEEQKPTPPDKKAKKKKKPGRITPLLPAEETALADRTNPPPATVVAPVPSVKPTLTPEPPKLPAGPVPKPARPAFARYHYLSPPKPKPGDAQAARALFLRGAKAHREGRLDAAATAYRQAIAADPTCIEARYNLGTLALNRQEYGVALQQLETALVIAPTNTTARFNFAVALEEAGFLLDAETEMLRVLRAEPNNVEVHLALAGLYEDLLHQPEKARLHFERVLQLAPHHPQAAAIRRWLARFRRN
jgi:tetratricopeptide (TPR) repeat protein